MGVIEGNPAVSDNDWETITKGGDAAIEKWIKSQMEGRTCTIVLIGTNTAGRKWINHEIVASWKAGMGLLGVHIHNLKDLNKTQCAKGRNPFEGFNVGKTPLSSIVKTYDPPFAESTLAYSHIQINLEKWIEDAIKIRASY
jgi:hypothetical protein